MSADNSVESKSPRPWHRCRASMIIILVCLPIFILANKWFLDYYFAHTSQGYALYVPQLNLAMVVTETTFLGFLLWLGRRRCQFSVRTLLIVVTLFAAACSWFAVNMQNAKRQREAVDTVLKWRDSVGIKNIGVSYDWQTGSSAGRREPPIPSWLRNALGDDFFYNVSRLYVNGADLTGHDLTPLEGMSGLQDIMIVHCKITEGGLEHLNGLARLRVLTLSGTNITDDGLKKLRGPSRLQRLYLARTAITDAGLEHLKALPGLQDLGLEGTAISDAGLAHLKALPQLQFLRLSGTSITNAGVAHLRTLTKLQWLLLDRTNVSDAGLEHVDTCTPIRKYGNTSVNLRNYETKAHIEHCGLGQQTVRRKAGRIGCHRQSVQRDGTCPGAKISALRPKRISCETHLLRSQRDYSRLGACPYRCLRNNPWRKGTSGGRCRGETTQKIQNAGCDAGTRRTPWRLPNDGSKIDERGQRHGIGSIDHVALGMAARIDKQHKTILPHARHTSLAWGFSLGA
jgi:hypothetical protein